MVNRFTGSARGLALALVLTGGLGALGWIWWGAARRSDINFLPTMAPADWIVYPAAPDAMVRSRLDLPGVFLGSLELKAVPTRAELRVAGFHEYVLTINGAPAGAPLQTGKTWKQPDVFEVSHKLRAGTNFVMVTVYNSNGPPALWLSLDAGEARLTTGEDWAASYGGATRRLASLASRPKVAIPGTPLYGGDRPGDALRNRWPLLLVLAGFSVLGYWLTSRAARAPTASVEPNGAETSSRLLRWLRNGWGSEKLLLLGLAGAWIVLFANNLDATPGPVGFDVAGHLAYVGYLLAHHAVPTASEGWEMFQPPLYYLLGVGWLLLTGLAKFPASHALALRILGLGIGLAHLLIVWKSLQCLFPAESARRRWGLLVAAVLPPMLYLSQYVTNEMLAATLVSACVYLTLRVLERPALWGRYAILGACLGAALLSKSSAVLALPPIVGALVWKWMIRETDSDVPGETAASARGQLAWRCAVRMGVLLAVSGLVCGWHYGRVWLRYGNPFIGVWDPRTGFFWWQDDGYRTSAFYLRFGQALIQPWFCALQSFWDGIYATLWGDGLLGGAADHLSCPAWNYDLMAFGYWLALVPTAAVAAGSVAALRCFLRNPRPEWFLLLGLGFVAAFAVVQMSLTAPYYCTVKAFYGLAALVPFCALGGWGFDTLLRRSGRWRWLPGVIAGLWALNVGASFWIARGSTPTLLIRSRSLVQVGRAVEAAAPLRARLARSPTDSDTREMLASVLALTGNPEDALSQAERSVTEKPNDASKHLLLALLLGPQRAAESLAHARRAVELAPGDPAAFPPLTTLLLNDQQFAEAVRQAREGLANNAFSGELHWALATGLLRLGQVEEAGAQLRMAANLPANASVHSRIGSVYQALNQTSQAVAQYQEALRLDPQLADALHCLAWIRATHPDAQFRNGVEAVALARRACEATGSQEPLMVGTLAAAYAETGRFDEALSTALKARDLALAVGQPELVARNQELIDSYRAGKAWRESLTTLPH